MFKFICESSTNELGGSSYTDQMLLNTMASAVLKWSPFKGSFLDGKLFKLKTLRYPAFANLISQATPTIIIIIITHPPASLLKKLSDQKHIILLEWPNSRIACNYDRMGINKIAK